MDIRSLKLFRHLAGSLHFAKTSRACHITPSALTRLVQRLEAEVGEQLFIRDNRSVALTAAGRAFRRYAEDVILRWETLRSELSADAELSGALSIYCSVTAAYAILPDIISQYRRVHPRVHINLETGDAAKALAKVANREADAAIAALPRKPDRSIRFLELSQSPLVFIAPRKFPDIVIQDRDGIDWEQTPLILADFGLSRELLDRWFAAHGIRPNIYSQVSGHEAIIALVTLGCGVGLVPELVLEKSPITADVEVLANTPDLPAFVIGLAALEKQMSNPLVNALWTIAGPDGADPDDTAADNGRDRAGESLE